MSSSTDSIPLITITWTRFSAHETHWFILHPIDPSKAANQLTELSTTSKFRVMKLADHSDVSKAEGVLATSTGEVKSEPTNDEQKHPFGIWSDEDIGPLKDAVLNMLHDSISAPRGSTKRGWISWGPTSSEVVNIQRKPFALRVWDSKRQRVFYAEQVPSMEECSQHIAQAFLNNPELHWAMGDSVQQRDSKILRGEISKLKPHALERIAAFLTTEETTSGRDGLAG